METKLSIILVFVGLMVSNLMTGCSGTKTNYSWSSPNYTGKIDKVYVVGISKKDLNRMIFENTFESRLTSEGVKVVASYKDLLSSVAPEKEAIIRRMKANDCDSILLTRVLNRQKKAISSGQGSSRYSQGRPAFDNYRYSQGSSGLYNQPKHYLNWDSYYNYGGVEYAPPASIDIVTVTLESVLYDLKTEELIWSAQLETKFVKDIEKSIRLLVDRVTKDLKDKGLI
jgi:hypothetical protein